MPDFDRPLLNALLDTIVPPTSALAGAGGLGLAAAVLDDAARVGATPVLEGLAAALPDDFADRDLDSREALLRAEEAHNEGAIRTLVNLVYTAYYTDPRVLVQIHAATGYNAVPPQPQGYPLEPFGDFDESLLAPVRGMQPIWRRVP